MKALRFLFGRDSSGRHVERAQAINGVWYCREYYFNGYARDWSKWEKEPDDMGDPLFWGWNSMTEAETIPGIRLPDSEKLLT